VWQDLVTKFYETPPTGSKVINGGTYRQAGNLISLLSCLESRLQM
jgi:hypothetical protein